MLNKPKRILIVGGGTAGWMAANTLLKNWPDAEISLVESKDIGIIGVGEGATPYLKQYFRELNISESQWMPACDATYKVGISFENWSTVGGYTEYFHPFFSHLDQQPAEMFFYNSGLRRRGYDADATPANYFVAAQIAAQRRLPLAAQGKTVDIDYAYHFDAAKLGRFLRDIAIAKGLNHIVDNVSDVLVSQSGDIEAVVTEQHGLLSADLYIDCSGFRALLINQALKQEYRSYQDCLFNNAAVALPTARNTAQSISPQTRSIALSHGWMWNIPLTSRTGNGYVYSSDFITPDQAETELRQTLEIPDSADVSARHLKMRIGRLDNHWHKNCLAVGLSQGFIEPLEATALMLVQFTLQRFVDRFGNHQQCTEQDRAQYNSGLNQTFDGVRDYIVAHYKLNTRSDSQYWIANRENKRVPDALATVIDVWDSGQDVEKALASMRDELVYLRPSWYCILSGMGRFPKSLNSTNQAASHVDARQYCQTTANNLFRDSLS